MSASQGQLAASQPDASERVAALLERRSSQWSVDLASSPDFGGGS